MITGGQAPRWWRITGRTLIAAAALWSLTLLWVDVTKYGLVGYVLLFYALIALATTWLIWLLIGRLRYHTWHLFFVAPLLAAAASALVATGLSADAGWWLSRSALERAATDCAPTTTDHRLGVYTVTTVEQSDGGCLFTIPGMGFLDAAGFAYMPAGNPPAGRGDGDEFYTHLDGPWYTFTVPF